MGNMEGETLLPLKWPNCFQMTESRELFDSSGGLVTTKRASRDRWYSWREADFPLLIRTSKSHGILPIAIYGCCSAVGSALEMRRVIMIPLGRLRTSVSM